MNIDPWILAFSAVTVIATIWMGFWSAKRSKTTGDFFVAGRSVSVGWNASAISGEYLSAASFMGIAGMVMSSGYDALWYPVCYACGYLFLLLFIAGPLRRFGAYTIPDFAEGRFDSPVFRKIAVVFVLFIGFFYTMPQMKGAGTTLAYIFPGLPYWAGVVLVGAVITLNVALGGMKGITLVQAFQYWIKMFAISVPIFVLMAVYGNYGRQVGANAERPASNVQRPTNAASAAFQVGRSTLNVERSPDSAKGAMDTAKQVPASANIDLSQFAKFEAGSPYGDGVSNPKEPNFFEKTRFFVNRAFRGEKLKMSAPGGTGTFGHQHGALHFYARISGRTVFLAPELAQITLPSYAISNLTYSGLAASFEAVCASNGIDFVPGDSNSVWVVPIAMSAQVVKEFSQSSLDRILLPAKAPTDSTWLSPFGPLTTKAAKAAAAVVTNDPAVSGVIPLAPAFASTNRVAVNFTAADIRQVLPLYSDLTARTLLPRTNAVLEKVDSLLSGQLTRWQLIEPGRVPFAKLTYHPTNYITVGELKRAIEDGLKNAGITLVPVGDRYYRAIETSKLDDYWKATVEDRQRAWLAKHERPLALLYTYSLIIALVCGTAGLPHILVRFYTNPDGVAAKRTTMWVMILIGVFYLFPPIFGVMGRNLLPSLYEGVGAKGTDKVVLELPRILNRNSEGDVPRRGEESEGKTTSSPAPSQPSPTSRDTVSSSRIPWGSILSGITCAGAFAAFMSTFSGLLVSMTGAMAHDVYGRIFRPKSTPAQRLRAFKVAAVVIGTVAILLGMQVEQLQINFMVGQAFAIAAASYFPLLFVSVWWRGLTTKGAAVGMLTGGIAAVVAVSLTNFSDLKWMDLAEFWAAHPLLRILCEQPAIWTVPLAIGLMFVVSRFTRNETPSDIRMKMLVLHAPEKLGLKQEYIQEHGH